MFKKYQLKNGMTVLLVESPKSPVVSVQTWVRTGSADEMKGEEGISHFIEHLVFKGTERFKVGEIASTVEGDGGELNAYTSFDQTVFYVTISKNYSDTALQVISQMMGFPSFDAPEIDNEREVVIEEIKRSIDSPHRQASRLLFETIFQKHPYGIPVIGYEKIIKKVAPKAIKRYFNARYVPSNMTLLVVGDFSAKDIKSQIKKCFGSIEPFKLKKTSRKKEPKQERPRFKVKQGPFKETLAHLAWRTPKGTHKDIPGLELISLILGQGDSSRLMRSLRIDESITNYTYAGIYAPLDGGFFNVSSSLNAEAMERALEKINEELLKFLSEGPSKEELEKAVLNIESEHFFAMETVDGLAQTFGSYEHAYGDYKHFEKFLSSIKAYTPEDLIKVARKYLQPDRINCVVMSPESADVIKRQLRNFAKAYKKGFKSLGRIKPALVLAGKKKKIKTWKVVRGGKAVVNKKVKLTSGAQLVLRPCNDVPVVSLRAAFPGGLRIENKLGVNELLSRTWLSGTKKLSENDISQLIENRAARFSSFSGRNSNGLYLTALKEHAEDLLDLFGQVLQEPTFPEDVIEREKKYMLESYKNRKDNPAQIAVLQFMQNFFKNHPYGRDSLGDDKSIASLSRADVVGHLEKLLCAKTLHIAAVGDLVGNHWQKRLSDMTNLKGKDSHAFKAHALQKITENEKHYSHSDKEQTHILMGGPGVTFKSTERYTLEVIQAILSGQGGRLFIELRDKASLAYSVAPLRMDGVDAGYFGAYIACSPEKGKKAVGMMEDEFTKLMQNEPPAEEIEAAKRNLIGRHDIGLQRTQAVASSIVFDDIYGLPFDESFHFAEKISSITGKDIQALAQKLFSQPRVYSAVGSKNPF